jgi:hypothetical protein
VVRQLFEDAALGLDEAPAPPGPGTLFQTIL